jgi:Ni,Fe-hydrogenase III large subunit
MAARAAGFPAPFQDAMERREILFDALETVTGERVYWAVSIRGGVRPDLDVAPLRDPLTALEPTVAAWRVLAGPKGSLGRALRGAAPIPAERADALGLTGLAARGSRILPDLRTTTPYAGYSDVTVPAPPSPDTLKGDVASRLAVAVDDIGRSLTIALACVESLVSGGVSRAPGAASGQATGCDGASTVEGPHGPVTATITLAGDAAAVTRVRLEPPGAANLAALPALLEGQPLAQAPVILAGLDLCLECLDL